MDNLGVRTFQLYVQYWYRSGGQNLTATGLATVFMRRVGGGQQEPYALPHQAQDAIRGFFWVEDPVHPAINGYKGHIKLACDQMFFPQLRVETVLGGEPLAPVAEQRPPRWGSPIHFIIKLPPGAGDCFKVYDASYPLIKRGVCLRHHRNICNALAPPDRHTDKTPALWATLGPLRDYLVPHGPAWVQQHTNYAIYLHHYLTYQLQMGINGVIYYGNAWSLGLLQQQSVLHTYLRDGTLRFIEWDYPDWRADDPERGPRYNGINYDQTLVASHGLLGFSGCGTNLMLLLGDVDEFLHTASGKPWPHPDVLTCLQVGGDNWNRTGIVNLRRRGVVSSTLPMEQEPGMWANGTSGQGLEGHPLSYYDQMEREPKSLMHGKNIAVTAQYIVGFVVHDGHPTHGETLVVNEDCMRVLHVENHVTSRMKYEMKVHEPIKNHMFSSNRTQRRR